ncbi:Mitochondrial ATPase complex subunit atp10 [Thoreauomyces humboldtii]|nr:Mitochondrial ATPase complex subunit atp10 [Thoreauomyces humboldtii]
MPPSHSQETGEQHPASPSTETPAGPQGSGLLNRFAAKLRKEVEELESARKARELAEAGPVDPNLPPLVQPEAQKKQGFFAGIDNRLQEQRKELEADQLAKRKAGEKSRMTPKMQKRMDEYLDLDENLRQREELLKWFSGLTEIYANQASPMVPNPVSKTLTGETTDVMSLIKTRKASLVTFMFSAFGERHVNTFTEPFMREFADSPNVQLIQLNVEENWLKAPLLRLMTPWVRRRVPKELQAKYLMHFHSILEARRSAGMTNSVLGWVNLVDSEGRIRWQAHGPAREHELETLLKATRMMAEISQTPRPGAEAP